MPAWRALFTPRRVRLMATIRACRSSRTRSAIRCRPTPSPSIATDRKSTRLNSSHTVIYTLSLHDALPIFYAASSSTYGDHPGLPKLEDQIGNPLSPYAVTKYCNVLYASVYTRCYGLQTIGLRYFNVFGPRQDPHGAYAAVIPQWVAALIGNQPLFINGDGETSRDFCFIDNLVQANLLAATADDAGAAGLVYNVALGERTTLLQLYQMMQALLRERFAHVAQHRPQYQNFRVGDIRHSQADIGKARALLGYAPTHSIKDGLYEAMDWYVHHLVETH